MVTTTKTSTSRKVQVPKDQSSRSRFSRDRLKEPSTWAGIISIACAVATGGASAVMDPVLQPVLIAGLGLVLNKEG